MMFISPENQIVRRTVERFAEEPEKRGLLDMTVHDFDGVKYKLVIDAAKPDALSVNVSIPFFAHIAKDKVDAMLHATYPGMVATSASAEYNVALRVEAPTAAAIPDAAELARRVSRLAVEVAGCMFRPSLEALAAGGAATDGGPASFVPYRPSEHIWVVPRSDRLTVVWSLEFPNAFDAALGRVIASELAEAGRKVPAAPSAIFYDIDAPPAETRDTAVTLGPNAVGFVSITLLKSHVETPAKLSQAVDKLVLLRAFLLYHIKAAKAALHTRMRARVDSWLQVLRRASPGSGSEKASSAIRKAAHAAIAAGKR
ncbi:hypothetical protein FNF28_01418 [Cafeteria roenbergensis]|nr:hypothetical protein FNF28_01418 [Cafeteria roenbergensis]